MREIDIGSEITTAEGRLFEVVDMTPTEYIVRADITGNDASRHGGIEGVDWEYIYIPFGEAS